MNAQDVSTGEHIRKGFWDWESDTLHEQAVWIVEDGFTWHDPETGGETTILNCRVISGQTLDKGFTKSFIFDEGETVDAACR
jgi:hypothetical protein